jgi:hypothetical protein
LQSKGHMNFIERFAEFLARLILGLFGGNKPVASDEEENLHPQTEDLEEGSIEDESDHPQRPGIDPPPADLDISATEEETSRPEVSTTSPPDEGIEPADEQPLPGEIDSGQTPACITVRVKMLVFNPTLPGGKTLIDTLGFNDPEQKAKEMIADMKQVSNGCLSFDIVERQMVDALPKKLDGYTYNPQGYVETYRTRIGFHQPDAADYSAILDGYGLKQGIQANVFDEVWIFAPPYSGLNESVMGGAGAFFCNASPLAGTEDISRRFFLMGFNYERGEGEMLENMGHRAEFTLLQVYRRRLGNTNLWQRFTRIDMTSPGYAEVGSVHFAPNSMKDYEWNSLKQVSSRCDTWYNFPNLEGTPRLVDCTEWGGGDIRLHHLWWFKHFPHRTGQVAGISANWWRYFANPNFVR